MFEITMIGIGRVQVQGADPVFESGNLRVDLVRRLVMIDSAEVKLCPRNTTFCASSCSMRGKSSHTASS